jgi:hypothetical protein
MCLAIRTSFFFYISIRTYRRMRLSGMAPPQKALSPASRAKAGARNVRDKAKGAAKAKARGGGEVGKTKGHDQLRRGRAALGKPRPRFELRLEAQKNVGHLEAEELALAKEKVAFLGTRVYAPMSSHHGMSLLGDSRRDPKTPCHSHPYPPGVSRGTMERA